MNSAPSQAEIPSKNVQHNQSLFSVQLQLRWYWFSTLPMEEECIKQKHPAVNWESHGACWAAVQRMSVPSPSCYKSNSSHLRQYGTALTALNGSRRLIPPLDQSCQLQNDCPRRCQRECIIHLLHILSLWLTWLPALARHYFYRRRRSISAVQLSQNHRMSEPLGGPCSDRLMIKTAEIMLTSLSCSYKPVISGDAPPPFFFIADALCCVQLCLRLNLRMCTGGQVLQSEERLSPPWSRFLSSLLLLAVVLQSWVNDGPSSGQTRSLDRSDLL